MAQGGDLAEGELQGLLGNGQDEAGDLFPVLRQLRPYLLNRGRLIDVYHRNLFKAVRERYLPSQDRQCAAHGHLATYFEAQGYFLELLAEQRQRALAAPATARPVNQRKVDEYHRPTGLDPKVGGPRRGYACRHSTGEGAVAYHPVIRCR